MTGGVEQSWCKYAIACVTFSTMFNVIYKLNLQSWCSCCSRHPFEMKWSTRALNPGVEQQEKHKWWTGKGKTSREAKEDHSGC
ncbi:hypothetical protein SUGI_0791460 [Cryptomeria japonica]|nr:hypothetical protein SUGI_0791460 [Cryptomeria japonica]